MNEITETKTLMKSGASSAGVIIPKHWLQILGIQDIKLARIEMTLNLEKKTVTIKKL